MMSEKAINEKFSKRGHVSKGELYLPIDVAKEYLIACRENMVTIIGIESFQLRDGKLLPDIEMIADFSSYLEVEQVWNEIVGSSYEDARRFVESVEEKHGGALLNFVLASENTR